MSDLGAAGSRDEIDRFFDEPQRAASQGWVIIGADQHIRGLFEDTRTGYLNHSLTQTPREEIEVLQALEEAVAIEPYSAKARINLADHYMRTNCVSQALGEYRLAQECVVDDQDAVHRAKEILLIALQVDSISEPG
jgi:hypothetical protein